MLKSFILYIDIAPQRWLHYVFHFILDSNSLDSINPGTLKEVYYGVATLVIEAVKIDSSLTDIRCANYNRFHENNYHMHHIYLALTLLVCYCMFGLNSFV